MRMYHAYAFGEPVDRFSLATDNCVNHSFRRPARLAAQENSATRIQSKNQFGNLNLAGGIPEAAMLYFGDVPYFWAM